MKILWLTNVKLPIIYRFLGERNQTVVAGWLDQISERMIHDHQLVVCYPSKKMNGETGNVGNLSYYGLYFNDKKLEGERWMKKNMFQF